MRQRRGTADGQLADVWVIFTAAVHGPQVIGVLTPQQPFSPGVHVPYFNDEAGAIVIAPGTVVVPSLVTAWLHLLPLRPGHHDMVLHGRKLPGGDDHGRQDGAPAAEVAGRA